MPVFVTPIILTLLVSFSASALLKVRTDRGRFALYWAAISARLRLGAALALVPESTKDAGSRSLTLSDDSADSAAGADAEYAEGV